MRIFFKFCCVLALVLQGGAAFAQSYEQAILAKLRQEGYVEITLTTTLLGRIRILALGDKGQREIVLNPRTGEVLRDVYFVAERNSSSGGASIQSGRNSGGRDGGSGSSGSGSGSSDDDDDDDDDGDDRNDDNDNDENEDSNDSSSGGGGDSGDDDDD